MDAKPADVIFFDLGDTLGAPLFSTPPIRLVGFDVFPYVPPLLVRLAAEAVRLGIISNSGDEPGSAIDAVLATAGLLPHFAERDLRIYSADVRDARGRVVTKDSPEIFRLAAERAGVAIGRCVFVGEDSAERATAADAGMRVCPHPLLVGEVLAGEVLRFVRIVPPPAQTPAAWRAAVSARAVVALRFTDRTLYAVTSERVRGELVSMGFAVETLGDPDAPLRDDLFLLRDDVARETGFVASGQSAALFRTPASSRLVVGSGDGAGELVVALPAERDLDTLHFRTTRHGHTVKLMPQPALLDAWGEDDAPGPAWLSLPVPSALTGPPRLVDSELAQLREISAARIRDRVERYSGREPIDSSSDPAADHQRIVRSRHAAHADNGVAVVAAARELEVVGDGRLAVRLHKFTHRGRTLFNVEADLPGSTPEVVVVSAHLDSTAASGPYRPADDPAPGADDDGSGLAAVLTIAERFVVMARGRTQPRTIRFVLFNAEEEGLVGSQAYASYQRSIDAPIVAVLQMDMIGYNKDAPRSWEIHAGFSRSRDIEKRSVALGRMIAEQATQVSPSLEAAQPYRSDGVYQRDPAEDRSDHAAFHAHGYAACVCSEDLFAGPDAGSPAAEGNPDYHAPTDTFVDYDYAADIARAVAATAWLLSFGDDR